MQIPLLVAPLAVANVRMIAATLKLLFVRVQWVPCLARRTSKALWARHPETRPATYEHPPAQHAPDQRGWVMAPTASVDVVGVQNEGAIR